MRFTSLFIYLTVLPILISCQVSSDKSNTTNTSDSGITQAASQQPATEAAAKTVSATSPDFHLLTGDWVRSDGGYTISIRSITAEGTLTVEYYNPNPIKVGKARWEAEDDSLYVQVELQDVNYPGSTYTLQYLPEADQLAGIYFQAVEGVTYEVLFNRKR